MHGIADRNTIIGKKSNICHQASVGNCSPDRPFVRVLHRDCVSTRSNPGQVAILIQTVISFDITHFDVICSKNRCIKFLKEIKLI